MFHGRCTERCLGDHRLVGETVFGPIFTGNLLGQKLFVLGEVLVVQPQTGAVAVEFLDGGALEGGRVVRVESEGGEGGLGSG